MNLSDDKPIGNSDRRYADHPVFFPKQVLRGLKDPSSNHHCVSLM